MSQPSKQRRLVVTTNQDVFKVSRYRRPPYSGQATIRPLRSGEKVPDDFWTKKHLFYLNGDTVRKSLEEYKGTLLIIDFWATWCGACRVNFPKLEELKQNFGNEISFILINPTVYKNNFDQISKAYEEFKNSGGSSLESIIFDEYFVDLFPHIGIPRYIWINKKGRFIASTGNLFVNGVTIKKVLDGKY